MILGANSLVRASIKMSASSQDLVNVLYFKQLSAGGDLGGLSDAIKTTLYDVIKTMSSANWTLDDITLSEQIVGGGEQLVTTYALAGTNANANQNLTTCAVATFRTALAGRSHRGRNYVPILSYNVIDDGLIGASFRTALQDAYDAFTAIYGVGGTDTDYQWGVWSRKLGETLSGSPPHVTAYDVAAGFFPIVSVNVTNVVRQQRRREYGVGS